MIANKLISDVVPALKTSDTGLQALNIMDIFRISHLPIVNNYEFLGLISDTDIFDLNEPEQPIGNHELSLSKPYVYEDDHIYKILELFGNDKLTVIPVLDRSNTYLGLIILQDIVQSITELFALNQPGGIIVLEINVNNYSLSEISQIVESNNAKIISMNMLPIKGTSNIYITLKTNLEDVTPIMETFDRYNYNLKVYYSTSNIDLDELYNTRYDSLIKYLNI
jgi:CBS domain-containing protein